MKCEKFFLSVDVELSKESLHNAYKMIMYRLPRKRKKRWKASIAKRYGLKPNQLKLKEELVWKYIKSGKEDIENIYKWIKSLSS